MTIPVVLLASTPFIMSCTQDPVSVPAVVTPTVTGSTETILPPVDTVPSDITSTGESAPVPVTNQSNNPSTVVTRTETVYYDTPAGSHPVEFAVTVDSGVITAVAVTPKAEHEISQKLQTAFASNITEKVVGKKISELELSAVGGASLTTTAFNAYIRSF